VISIDGAARTQEALASYFGKVAKVDTRAST
jgi:hypothetical protein